MERIVALKKEIPIEFESAAICRDWMRLTPMYSLLIVLFLGIHIHFLLPSQLMAQPDAWRGKLKDGKEISDRDLKKMLEDHARELEDIEKVNWGELDFERAAKQRALISDISRGSFNEADLNNVDLRRVNLTGGYFKKTDLTGANLVRSNFEGAYFSKAKLRGANLRRINLQHAEIIRSDLSNVLLEEANLRGAILENGSLEGAKLTKSDITGAKFSGTDLAHVVYEPRAPGQPDVQSISRAMNLHLMKYDEDRSGLVSLKNNFQKFGFRNQERDITFALKKRDYERLIESGKRSKKVEGYFLLVFCEWTSQYGRKPGFPLLLMISLLGICYILYFVVILFGGKGTVWKVLPKELQLPNEKHFRPVPVEFARCTILEVLWYPLYLGLLSAFRIGWRDINVGTWLSMSLPVEYTLVPRRWVKLIAGIQSAVSVYLLALSILTYFGRPFE